MTSSSTYYSNISFSLHIQHLSKKQAYPAKNRSCTIVQKHQETTNVQQKREKSREIQHILFKGLQHLKNVIVALKKQNFLKNLTYG